MLVKTRGMKIDRPWSRLAENTFWRRVDTEHNRIIANELRGARRILDIGCGYGSLTRYLLTEHVEAIGVDPCFDDICRGRDMFLDLPESRLMVMTAEHLGFGRGTFDAVVLRDALHHLYGEAEIDQALAEIERILTPKGKLVVFDPQPNFVVLFCRNLAHHEDFRCSSVEASRLLEQRGWMISSLTFTELFALPLSGGYVGYCLAPPARWLWGSMIRLNRVLSRLMAKTPLAPFILWRYVLVAQSPG